ncbi:MAG: eCIS core domain-containing protein [Thermoanaerobaculia bacterium]
MLIPEGLQALLDDTRARVRVGYPWWLRHLLARDVVAITLGRTIFVSPQFAERPPEKIERLLRHELAHVRQVVRHGLIFFLWLYVTEFARHWWRVRDVTKAYLMISFEVEANAAERGELQTPL